MNLEIEKYFIDLVENYKPLLKLLPIYNNAVNILLQYFPLLFEANFIIKDTGEEFYFRIAPEYSTVSKKRNPYAMMSIILNEQTCFDIIKGRKSLLREYNRGIINISNLKQVYMYRIILLGMIFQSKREDNTINKLLQILPLNIIKNFIQILLSERVSNIIFKLVNKFSQKLVDRLLD
ncbi:MAG: hypothetical protein EU551_03005 [Promethearchaeota archaeon]|nr:MAG: hypothetical protein EU551_03005 [Candidatus Lokiarchaeota archaeon]